MNNKKEEQKLFWDKMKKNNEIKKYMLNEPYYLDWLIRFMNIYPCGFSDYDVCEDEFDNQNLQKLHLFYEIIESYVMHNYLTEFMNKNSFFIKYNNSFFEISKKWINGNYKISVLKASVILDKRFVDFNDVRNNKHSESFDVTNKIIQELTGKIDELYQSGVPISYIKIITNRVINDVASKKEREYVYKKEKIY